MDIHALSPASKTGRLGIRHLKRFWEKAKLRKSGHLAAGASPREQDIESLGPVPLAANAGDFIIWHYALPHGSSPNNASLPRYVQYINYAPIDREVQEEWI